MIFRFTPAWESSNEDDDASFIYEEIVIPKIKKIGLEPRWDRYEEMPITGWMTENEDEMDFTNARTQHPLERIKEMWRYLLEDLGIKSVNQDLPEDVEKQIMTVIDQGIANKTQNNFLWEQTDMNFGISKKSEMKEVLTTLRTDELKNAHIFTPPSPPPKTDLKSQVEYLWNNTESMGGEKKLPEQPENGSSGDRASWLQLADNQVKGAWEGDELRSRSSMSFNRDFRWMTSFDSDDSLIYQTFEKRATLHFRPKNTSNHITKITTVSSEDKVQIRRYFTHLPNQNNDEYYRTTVTQFIKSISYAANSELPEGNKDKPFTVDGVIIKKFLDQDENMWIYDSWEKFFTKEWRTAAREAYESMTPALLGLSIESNTTHWNKDGFGGFTLGFVFNYHSWFDMKKVGGVERIFENNVRKELGMLKLPVEFSLFHGYTTYAEQKHPRLRYYERGLGVFNWWW